MLIQEIIGKLNSIECNNRVIDHLNLEWYETKKRVLRKSTEKGEELSLKFLSESHVLNEGDVLFMDAERMIVVSILPCECIVAEPENLFEMASICYEIGNKHLPLFFENDQLLIPFEKPFFKLLQTMGYKVTSENRKLLQPLKTTVTPHAAAETLFTKIMKLKNPSL